jgi:hypothetical protein
MGAGVTGNTEVQATKAEIIAAMVQKELGFKSQLLAKVLDVSIFAIKGAKSISFPKFTEQFTVQKRASGTAGNKQKLQMDLDTLLLSENAYVQWLIDSVDEVQSSVEVQSEYIKRVSSAHARGIDLDIIAALKAAAGLNQGAANVITEDIILDMRQYLLDSYSVTNDMTLLVSTTQEKAMLKIPNFILANNYGNNGNIANGVIGKVYGVEVMVHGGLAAADAIMFDKEAIAFGFQKGSNYSEQLDNDYGSTAMKCVVDQLYGLKALQLGQNGAAAGKCPLIAIM